MQKNLTRAWPKPIFLWPEDDPRKYSKTRNPTQAKSKNPKPDLRAEKLTRPTPTKILAFKELKIAPFWIKMPLYCGRITKNLSLTMTHLRQHHPSFIESIIFVWPKHDKKNWALPETIKTYVIGCYCILCKIILSTYVLTLYVAVGWYIGQVWSFFRHKVGCRIVKA